MTMIRRTPPRFRPMNVNRAFDRLFDDATFRPLAWGRPVESRLPLDVTSTDEAVTVEAAVPGVSPDDVEITVHQENLTISVKTQAVHEQTEGERVYRELRRNDGTRTIKLPNGMDTENATATFENGMLRLSIPRAEAAKPRHIPLTSVTEAPVEVAAETQDMQDEVSAETAEQA